MKSKLILFILSLTAVLGSLYLENYGNPILNLQNGEGLFPALSGYVPCRLCWWQRIFMYPIPLIAGLSLLTKEPSSKIIMLLSFVGACISTYHYIIQKIPINTGFECSATNPCSAFYIDYFGFITIPFLALVAFIGIFVLAYIDYKKGLFNKE